MKPFQTLLLFLACSSLADAQSRCECEYDDWVGDCYAEIEIVDNWATLTSSTAQCSRVDWSINGNPEITIITDGLETQEILFYKGELGIEIQSCKICKDKMFGQSTFEPATVGAIEGLPGGLSPFDDGFNMEDAEVCELVQNVLDTIRGEIKDEASPEWHRIYAMNIAMLEEALADCE